MENIDSTAHASHTASSEVTVFWVRDLFNFARRRENTLWNNSPTDNSLLKRRITNSLLKRRITPSIRRTDETGRERERESRQWVYQDTITSFPEVRQQWENLVSIPGYRNFVSTSSSKCLTEKARDAIPRLWTMRLISHLPLSCIDPEVATGMFVLFPVPEEVARPRMPTQWEFLSRINCKQTPPLFANNQLSHEKQIALEWTRTEAGTFNDRSNQC